MGSNPTFSAKTENLPAQAFVKGLDEAAFLASRLHQNAAIRSREVLGEAVGKVSAATLAAHPEISWLTGMRHSPPRCLRQPVALRPPDHTSLKH